MANLSTNRCPGTFDRRAFLRFGLAGWSSLSLADLLRFDARAAQPDRKSMIVLWLWGGPSHMETFDLKPDAPSEYRGEFRPIATNVSGIEISEHLPRLAKQADRFALVRSLSHDSPGHANSTHTMLTGYPGDLVETPPFRPKYPDAWSVMTRLCSAQVAGMPAHVSLPLARYHGAAYLGKAFEALPISADPNAATFRVPDLGLAGEQRAHLETRLRLLEQMDRFPREWETSGNVAGLDEFHRQAVSYLTSDRARAAFDIDREPVAIRDRYGRTPVGQRCLLARRLVEAGARLVTVDFPHVPGQKAFSWDDHASVWNIFQEMKVRLPVLDQVVSALIEDLATRGLDQEVLLVVMGEMSHTPKLSYSNGQPGREHWGRSMSVLLAGGGLKMGQVVGATDSKGLEPSRRPLTPNDLLATWYHFLGIDLKTHFTDHFGRPTPILPSGDPIAELF